MSMRAIAEELGVSRGAVARALARVQAQRDGRAAPSPRPRPRQSIIDPFEPILKELLAKYPNLTTERALQELQARGHSVRGFDRAPTPNLKDMIVGTLTNESDVAKAMRGAHLGRLAAHDRQSFAPARLAYSPPSSASGRTDAAVCALSDIPRAARLWRNVSAFRQVTAALAASVSYRVRRSVAVSLSASGMPC